MLFPKIQRPCPYKNRLADIMDGDVCQVCMRKVHDLNIMSDAERTFFLSSCSGEICVSYTWRPAIIAAASALAMSLPATAQDVAFEEEIIVGGINAAQVEYIADPNAVESPELPVVYEDEAEGDPPAEASASRTGADLGHRVESE